MGIRAVQYNGMCDSLSGKGGTCMYTLIIVDDDELIRKGLEKVIQWEKMGFSVSGTFKGAMDALEYLKNHTGM